jgi:hypothetical protein
MSSVSTTHGNTKTAEIKPHILHNRMPPQMQPQMHLAGCTHSSTVMTGEPGEPSDQESQLLGHRFGYGYNHIYPYLGGLGAYGAFGYGLGYPYRRCCGYRGAYPWFF